MKRYDYILVGQGIAGSLLAWELIKRGKSVYIINQEREQTSSKIAAGLYNPITGRKMVKTWMADVLFDGIISYYDQLEADLKAKFHHAMPIYRPFISIEEQNDWLGSTKDPNFSTIIEEARAETLVIQGIVDPFGGLKLRQSGYVDLPAMLSAFKKYFESKGIYEERLFTAEEVSFAEEAVITKTVRGSRLIFCEGTSSDKNPFFGYLKFRPVKGEIMDVRLASDLPHIVNRGVFMIPKGDFVRVGSTYDNHDMTLENTEKGINTLKEKLAKLYSEKFEVLRAYAGIRPATFDRKPFIGMLKDQQQIGIFNGLGTKGVSLAPHFSKVFVRHLEEGTPLPDEVSIDR
jgi:glycine/D-amino acid oxidase-like deaminating enzyme